MNLFDLADDPEAAADQLGGVMAKVWAQYWGPRTDDLARHAVLTLTHVPGSALADLPILLADTAYRRRVMGGVRRKLGAGRRGRAGRVIGLVRLTLPGASLGASRADAVQATGGARAQIDFGDQVMWLVLRHAPLEKT